MERIQCIEDGAQTILVVDDAIDTLLMIDLRLRREGYNVHAANNGNEALDYVRRNGLPDLVILDILMPGMNGFDVAAALRAMGDVPIIFLSSLSDANTKIEGLTRFAEDYITKPFAFMELLARVRRVLMRTAPHRATDFESVIDERLRVNFTQQCLIVDGAKVPLTPTENRLLHILFNNRGRVLSPGYLMAKAWDSTHSGTIESLWVHVRRLRYKMELDPDHPRHLITVRPWILPPATHRLDAPGLKLYTPQPR